MTKALLLILMFVASEVRSQGTGYAGRYAADDLFLIYVAEKDSSVTLRPAFWTSVQPLRKAAPDSFVVDDRSDRAVRFTRNQRGEVTGLFLTNIGAGGFYKRYASGRHILPSCCQGESRQKPFVRCAGKDALPKRW